MPSLQLAVIMPAYNEEGAIQAAVDEVRTHVLDGVVGSQLLVVDDGSRDRTGAILDAIAAADPRIRVLHQRNAGHGPAIMAGLDAVDAEQVFLIDSDRQIPLKGFARAWEMLKDGADGVFGVRRQRHDARVRLVLTVVVRQALRWLFRVRLHDANVPYKLLRRSVWQEAGAIIPRDTLTPSIFLAVYMARRGKKIVELDVEHLERKTGEVSIKRWKLMKFCARSFRQLLRFRVRLAQASGAEASEPAA